jgi:hypothetical protein
MSNGIAEQLAAWVAGKPVHNVIRDECCPDFSCCRPDLLWPEQQRKLFASRPDLQEQMLFMSLSAALELAGIDVYIAGQQTEIN